MATATEHSGSVLGGLFGFGGGASAAAAPAGPSLSPAQMAARIQARGAASTVADGKGAGVEALSTPIKSGPVPSSASASDGSPTSVAEDGVMASASAGADPIMASRSAVLPPDAAAAVAAATTAATPPRPTSPALVPVAERPPEEEAAPHMAEVDYDVNATSLYKNIESRQWAKALRLLETQSDEANARQCSTWVLRKEKNGKLRWRLLPIHGAIMFGAPLPVVEALLLAFPYGARCKDDQGMLPLHLAFRNDAPDDIVTELVSAHPPSIAVKDRKGRLPLGCALSGGASNKSRARLVDAYAMQSVSVERERAAKEHESNLRKRVDDLQVRQASDVDHVKKSFETTLVANIEKINKLEAESSALKSELDECQTKAEEKERSESELTEKVRDLTKALEAMTQMKRAESARYEEELQSFKSTRDDLLQKLQGLEISSHESLYAARRAETERAQETIQKDLLRSSMDDLINNHRLLADEREDLLNRNNELTALLERLGSDQEGMRSGLAKLEQDMNAAAVVRERMLAALAKQESDASALAEREYDAMRAVLDRQGDEVEDALRMWGAGGDGGPEGQEVEVDPATTQQQNGGGHPHNHPHGGNAGMGGGVPRSPGNGGGGGGGAPRDIYISRG